MTKHKKTDSIEERPVYLIIAIAGAFIAIIFYLLHKDSINIVEAQLVKVDNLVLSQDPVIKKSKGGNRILLPVQGYEKPFQVAGFDFNHMAKRNILQNIRQETRSPSK